MSAGKHPHASQEARNGGLPDMGGGNGVAGLGRAENGGSCESSVFRALAPSAQALRARGAAIVAARQAARRDIALKAVGAATVALYDALASAGPESVTMADELTARVIAAVERYRGMV